MNVRARSSMGAEEYLRRPALTRPSPGSGRGSRSGSALGRQSQLAAGVVLDLRKPAHLDLANAFAGEVQDRAHLFQRDAAPIRDVQRARLGHFPDLQMREIELDGPGLRVDVEIQ